MPDREKVIKGLETCYCPPSRCKDCPYYDLIDDQSCNDVLCLDALALLKEQEAELCDRCGRMRLKSKWEVEGGLYELR